MLLHLMQKIVYTLAQVQSSILVVSWQDIAANRLLAAIVAQADLDYLL